MEETKKLTPWELFFYYFKIGWFTFGGGWSLIAQMQDDFVEKKKLISSKELLDIVSMGRSLPGTLIGNVSYLFAFKQAGVLGGIAAVLGIISAPMIILSLITLIYTAFKENALVAGALVGVRAAVAPIIFSAVFRLWKDAFPDKICYVLFAAAFILAVVFNINTVTIILFGVIAGFILGKINPKVRK